MRITKKEIAQLNDILKYHKVDISRFEITNPNERIWKINYTPILLYFQIIKDDNNYIVSRYFADKKVLPKNRITDFKDVVTDFNSWVLNVWEEVKMENVSILPKFNERILEISPKFIEIYTQAQKAENLGLNEICGIGFRKSLEFLIKDFLILNTSKEDHEWIIENQIGQCLKKYHPSIIDDNILTVSKRAFWLGNDHAHYYMKWKSESIDDLKKLIELTINWILNKDSTEIYRKRMP